MAISLPGRWRRLAAALVAAVALIGATPAAAHPNHGAPAGQEEATLIALDIILQMIEQKVIEPSWERATQVEANLRDRGGQMEWVLIFANPEIRNKEERTLYIFLDQSGGFLAANYSGR